MGKIIITNTHGMSKLDVKKASNKDMANGIVLLAMSIAEDSPNGDNPQFVLQYIIEKLDSMEAKDE